MSLGLPQRRRKVRIDPALAIVNVVLLLIFFFLVSGQDRQDPLALDLPISTSLTPDRLPSPVLEIRPSGPWLLDGRPVQPELLAATLPDGPEPLHVMIDRTASARELMALLARPELAARPVRLVTLREDAP